MKIRHLYESVTANIIKELEAGTVPWTKPWKEERTAHGSLMPHNRATGRAYNGINVPILWSEALRRGYSTHEWLTFNQALSLGAQVRKGEKSTHVVFAKQILVKDEEELKRIGMLKAYSVFNASQVDHLPRLFERLPREPLELLGEIEDFIDATEAKLEHGGNRACYVGVPHDTICLPTPEQFKGMEHYYATTPRLCMSCVIGPALSRA
jgi:antirestriction protein ArdC